MAIVSGAGALNSGYAGQRRPRFGAAAGSLLVEAAVIAALIVGLTPGVIRPAATLPSLTDLPVEHPAPPPPRAAPRHATRPSGAAAPAGPRSRASPVVAAPSPIQRDNPLLAAIRPGQSSGLAAGASSLPGSGSGAGGAGFGNGAGGQGDGPVGATDPDWIAGRIGNGDYPAVARKAQVGGTTQTRISIGPNGRPSDCRVISSSGNRALDDTTCRLILKRFRFAPARDAAGMAVPGEVDYDQEWIAPPPLANEGPG